MNTSLSVKRVLLSTVIATLVLAALAGIYILLFSHFGTTEVKILCTALAISFFGGTALLCAAAQEKKQYPFLAFLVFPGLALSAAGFLFFLPCIWADWFQIDAIGKAMAIVGVLSFSLAHCCLLSLATLERRLAGIFYAAVASILVLGAYICGMILVQRENEWGMRIFGVLIILDVFFSLCVPILHWRGGKQEMGKLTETYSQIDLVCPRCGERGTYPTGRIRCSQCSLSLQVTIGE
jgi:ribosomal protein L37E